MGIVKKSRKIHHRNSTLSRSIPTYNFTILQKKVSRILSKQTANVALVSKAITPNVYTVDIGF